MQSCFEMILSLVCANDKILYDTARSHEVMKICRISMCDVLHPLSELTLIDTI